MKITGTGSVSNAPRSKKTGGVGGSDFAKMLDSADEVEESKVVGGIKPVAAINIIQEVDADGQKKRELVNKGNEILDKLEEIRDSLLFGDISISRLLNLQKIIDGVNNYNHDHKLESIIEEIKIRAAVELAKLGF